MEKRPDIASITTGAELRRWYWLKSELAAQARALGIKQSGAKFELLDRLAHFLDTGNVAKDLSKPPTSRFDWHGAPLTRETKITDNYRNTQNVRRFFIEHIGPDFKFSIKFMDWIKANVGMTLADAIDAQAEIAAITQPTQIQAHNQFNQYTRDFLSDNPAASMDDVRRVWARKRALPSQDGRHRYDSSDLDL